MSDLKHLNTRYLDRVSRNLNTISKEQNVDFNILTASSDLGVLRNGGRRGSNFGPQAIISNLLKMATHQTKHKFQVNEVSNNDFDQLIEMNAMLPFVDKRKTIINIGGGHDHIYPLLLALNQQYKKITVINIDAHLDTRIDQTFHSGTPFRQFAEKVIGEFHLIQIGIHEFANPDSNYQQLSNGKMDIISYAKLKKETKNFSLPCTPLLKNLLPTKFEADHALVFSLDCDAIESGTMEAVSAVNHMGLPFFTVEEILEEFMKYESPKYYGIYEYNPVYDNLSEKGSRAIAKLIYKIIE